MIKIEKSKTFSIIFIHSLLYFFLSKYYAWKYFNKKILYFKNTKIQKKDRLFSPICKNDALIDSKNKTHNLA